MLAPGASRSSGSGLDLERPAKLAARLPCSQERARQDRVRPRLLVAQPLAERAGLLAALARQRAKLVGLARRGLGMADEVETHGA